MSRAKRTPLTEAEWSKVFDIKCRSKSGHAVTDEERALTNRAFETDPDRFSAMEPAVFNATVPFGSNVRWSPPSPGETAPQGTTHQRERGVPTARLPVARTGDKKRKVRRGR